MSDQTFRALVVEEGGGSRSAAIRDVPMAELPAGEVLVRVAYSTLNYKDGLAVTGKAKILRGSPMVPGIDYAGTVVESASPDYAPGDEVILTGWGVGERHWGGFSQLARAKAGWLVPLPAGLSLRQAMGVGTAGFTAMLCVQALERHGLRPGGRDVVVTGAAGGVGSVAVALLSAAGYQVVASTGRPQEADYLRALGAHEIIDRAALAGPGKPLESERWAGAVDTVGGTTLAGLLRSTAYGGAVAACGNAGGFELSTTVLPFILRGVALLGVESVMVPLPERRAAWERIARDLPLGLIDRMTEVIPFDALPAACEAITNGQVRGRTVVDVNA
ncbi:oxidoreductase [Oscillochloris sp. ZM17-4]|uniref:acrylyl-CoA reductase (NADPH) n=1 Tax=Oscillochloris sp. ZM17-4 TaxID=2866714 RepID=UPI001C73DA00|nr:MDR family oxidoreductase [Oscillochloris sp. ZM17-4]MBX0329930.1 oxidoreductase [Oscillochloris sp. ZM17-4]